VDASLEEIINALAFLRTASGPGLARRIRLTASIEQRGRAQAAALDRKLGCITPRTQVERHTWSLLCNFWRESAQALTTVLRQHFAGVPGAQRLGALLPTLIARAIESSGELLRLMSLRYVPRDDALWRDLGFVYALADKRRMLEAPVPGDPDRLSVAALFAKLALFASSAPENLSPAQLDLAFRLVGAFAPGFDVLSEPRLGATYWIDLASSAGPQRYARPVPLSSTVRFFCAVDALEGVDAAIGATLLNSRLAPELAERVNAPCEEVLDVLRHFRAHWSPHLPARRHKRIPLRADISVTWGLEALLALLDPADPARTAQPMPMATWTTEDASRGGLSARAPQANEAWLAVGQLIGVKASGAAPWQVGLVKRLRHAAGSGESDLLVGVELLARQPRWLLAVPDGLSADSAFCTIALGEPAEGREVRLLVQPGRHVPTTGYLVNVDGRPYRLEPEQVLRAGPDYEMILCRARLRRPGG
jgi:hypothetical protein